MSWDIQIIKFPEGIESLEELADDQMPDSLGNRQEVMATLTRIFDGVQFDDDGWATYEGNGYSVEIQLGTDEDILCIPLMIRGNNPAVLSQIQSTIDAFDASGLDPNTDSGLFSIIESAAGFEQWQRYRDQISGQ